jgi:hypothetical protein
LNSTSDDANVRSGPGTGADRDPEVILVGGHHDRDNANGPGSKRCKWSTAELYILVKVRAETNSMFYRTVNKITQKKPVRQLAETWEVIYNKFHKMCIVENVEVEGKPKTVEDLQRRLQALQKEARRVFASFRSGSGADTEESINFKRKYGEKLLRVSAVYSDSA